MNNGIVRMMHYQITTVVAAAAAAAPIFLEITPDEAGSFKGFPERIWCEISTGQIPLWLPNQ